jgi:hypothetical protein
MSLIIYLELGFLSKEKLVLVNTKELKNSGLQKN